ncbi:Sec-independent protein translocase protein TatB [Phenylobacterium immobile]|uniref:Sec-independent protein translocase protein TatB n=1 Tax=Phenylobacterium immobile TaxID=21 RepID=UPI000ABB7B3A|nr:Sec-independent protein translocase protein TatB [Phenylobacterium immobile]
MLPEIGASELLVIAVVALIVVGPKDLPALLRKLGQMMAKARGMAADFRASFDEMARQSELDELRREVEAMRRGQLADIGQAEASETFGEIRKSLNAADWADTAQAADPPMTIEQIPEAGPEPKPARRRSPKPKVAADAAAKPAARKSRAKAKPTADDAA